MAISRSQIIAHRGFSAIAPENTLVAIQKALDIKPAFIEIDVHLTKDLIPIVFHDDTVERTTNYGTNKAITELTLEEIKKLDAGSWKNPQYKGEKIPTLEEVLNLDFGHTGLMIELKKSPFDPKIVGEKVTKALKKINPSFSIIIGSFEKELLQEIPTYPQIYIAEEVEKLENIPCLHVAVWEQILTPELIKKLLNQKHVLWSFTVDSKKRAEELIKQGIVGIITNNPLELIS